MKKLTDLIEDYGDKQIKDSATLAEPKDFDTGKTLERAVPLGGELALNVSLGGDFNGSLSLINEATDEKSDPEGIFIQKKYGDNDLQGLLKPKRLLDFAGNDKGYLRYSLGAGVAGGAGVSQDMVGISLEGSARWQSSYYSEHPFERDGEPVTIAKAILSDIDLASNGDDASALDNIKNLFSDDPTSTLKKGDVLSFAAGGAIGGSLEIDAAQLLAGSASFSGLFNEVIPVSYKGGITAKVSMALKGDFLLAIAVVGNDRIRVALRRSSEKRTGRDLTAGVSAEIDLSASMGIINDFLTGLTNSSSGQIQQLRTKVNTLVENGREGLDQFFNDLLSGEAAILSDWYDKLVDKAQGELEDWIEDRLDDVFEPIEKLNELLNGWAKKLQKYAKLSLSATLSFQYSKLDSTADVIRFECDKSTFNKLRPKLLAFNIDAGDLHSDPAIVLERFLNAELTEITKKSSLTFQIGSWKIGSSASVSKKWIKVKDYSDRNQPEKIRRVSYVGGREFDANFIKDVDTYSLSFDATSKGEFPKDRNNPPTLTDMDYSLSVLSKFKQDCLTSSELELIIDYGMLYGTLPIDDSLNHIQVIEEAGLRFQDAATVSIGLSLTKQAMLDFIEYVALRADSEVVANALAAAMLPWGRVSGRRNIAERIDIYKPIWKYVVDTDDDAQGMKDVMNTQLDHYKALHIMENRQWQMKRRSDNRSGGASKALPRSLAGIIRNQNRDFPGTVKTFISGMKELHGGLQSANSASYESFDEVFESVSKSWGFEYSSRWVAALMHQAIEVLYDGAPKAGLVEYTFLIEQGDRKIQLAAPRKDSLL